MSLVLYCELSGCAASLGVARGGVASWDVVLVELSGVSSGVSEALGGDRADLWPDFLEGPACIVESRGTEYLAGTDLSARDFEDIMKCTRTLRFRKKRN